MYWISEVMTSIFFSFSTKGISKRLFLVPWLSAIMGQDQVFENTVEVGGTELKVGESSTTGSHALLKIHDESIIYII